MPGTMGSYELKHLLGRGGMGEVYLAHDSRLGRDVALKVLPERLAEVPALRERFLREARAVAALNHPGIATIHEIGEANGRDFLAFEYVEGGDLEALPRDKKPSSSELIDWALAIAEALEFAHSKGVVHRDLKPANVMLSAIGRPKLLDFGLAKLLHDPAEETSDAALLTKEGDVLGTPAFMSPEQARGQPIDSRTDVFSFGSLLYRLAAGTEPFGGSTALETLDAVVHHEPRPLAQMRPDLPDGLLAVVEKSMRKQVGERYQHMSDVVADLRHLKRTTDSVAALATNSTPGWQKGLLPWVVVGLVVVVALALLWDSFGGSAPNLSAPRFSLENPRRVTSEAGLEILPSISRDGTQVAYSSGPATRMRIFIRSVDGGSPRPLTDDTDPYEFQPIYSPGGERILFLTPEGVFRAPALGGRASSVWSVSGPSTPVSEARSTAPQATAVAAAWSPDGERVFVSRTDGDPSIVSIEDGTEVPVAASLPLYSCSWSPRGEWIAGTHGNLLGVFPGPFYGNTAPSRIVLVRASDGELREVTDGRAANQSPVWSADGRHLLFVSNRDGPSDIYQVEIADDGSVVGDPVRVTTGLQVQSIALSADGTRLVYETYSARANLRSLPIPSGTAPVDASDAVRLTSADQVVEAIRVSPDGQYVVYDSNLQGNADIYRVSVDGGTPEQLTTDPADDFAGTLSPDGTEVAFHSFRGGTTRDVFVQPVRGGPVQQVTSTPGDEWLPAWSPVPGGPLAFWKSREGEQEWGLFLVTRKADGSWSEPELLLPESGSQFDWLPDGKHLACTVRGAIVVVSVESGDTRVLYEPEAPDDPTGSVRVSDDGSVVYLKSHDERGHASFWSVPIEGGRPTLLVRFTDEEHPSISLQFDVGAGRFFFTIDERESEVWIADLVR